MGSLKEFNLEHKVEENAFEGEGDDLTWARI